jgi:RNA polymerase sigma-70 factor (ECF subfamily)
MNPEPLDVLLEQLCSGDLRAAERAFVAYEPYLRKVVRRHLPRKLRAKFDSADVVQSVWAHVWHGFRADGWRFANPDQLRGFLVTVTRHRLINRLRHYHAAMDHERPLAETDPNGWGASVQPRPSEVLEADDLWEKMLALCPPAHHELLWLKRQGLSLAEIAARTGLHEGSIRRIIRKLARQLAVRPGPLPPSPSDEC